MIVRRAREGTAPHETQCLRATTVARRNRGEGTSRAFVGGLWEEIGTAPVRFSEKPRSRCPTIDCSIWVAARCAAASISSAIWTRATTTEWISTPRSSKRANGSSRNRGSKTGTRICSSTTSSSWRASPRRSTAAIAISVVHPPADESHRPVPGRSAQSPAAEARFFASYFEAPAAAYLEPLEHAPGNIVTNYDADPYHYAFEEVQWMAGIAQIARRTDRGVGAPQRSADACRSRRTADAGARPARPDEPEGRPQASRCRRRPRHGMFYAIVLSMLLSYFGAVAAGLPGSDPARDCRFGEPE